MVKIMENPIRIDDLGVPLFLETSIWTLDMKGPVIFQPATIRLRENIKIRVSFHRFFLAAHR